MSVMGFNRVRIEPNSGERERLWADPALFRERLIKASLAEGVPRETIRLAFNASPNTLARLRRELADGRPDAR
jgi:hypothetical protein